GDIVEPVAGNAEVAGLGAFAAGERGECESVGIDDLAGLRLGAGHHQLVARADDGDLRPAVDLDLRIVHRRREHQIAVVEAAAAREQHLALAEVDALAADVLALDAGALDDDAVVLALGHLLNDDAVGAVRHHAAGKDARRLAGADQAFEWMAAGGCVRLAARSAASTRPNASSSATVSVPSGSAPATTWRSASATGISAIVGPSKIPLVPAKAGTQRWIPACAGMSG